MTRTVSSTFLSLLIVIVAHQQYAQAQRHGGRTRSMLVALQDVNELKEKIANATADGMAPSWVPALKNNSFALMPNENFVFGVLEKPGTVRALPKRPPTNRRPPLKPGQTKPESGKIKIPRAYNIREVFGQKCPSLNHVMYQGSCGNCWAVSSTSMINDRSCMYQKDGVKQKFFSPKHLTTCLPKGCDGGWFADALQFWITDGMVTGGDFRMKQPDGCKPTPTDTGTMKNGKCEVACDDGSEIVEDEKAFGGARYEIKSKIVSEIMAEIYLYGPVIATFDVYDDFAHYYKNGVYTRASDKKLGAHAAKLFGWGVENGVNFWYAANSWGKDWGDGGFFKIRRGTNECGIETNIHAGIPADALF